jgi:subtilisin family serine protease
LKAAGATGKGQVVAILDSGVASNHPFLKGKVVGEACFGTKQSGPVEIVPFCPGGKTEAFGPGSGEPCRVEGCGHGTHVAGIVAGKDASFSGVASDAKLLAVQVFSKANNDPACDGPCLSSSLSDVIRGIEWVFEQRKFFKIAAVNMSLGMGTFSETCGAASPPVASAINLLRKANIAPVIASGNNSYATGISLPACLEGAISVGASTYNDTVAAFSNSANFLSLLAPGMSISAAQNGGIYSSIPGAQFINMSGTSMAAPHVSGAFAVLRSVKSNATIDQILLALQSTGKQIIDPRNGVAVSRIQTDRAVAAISGKSPDQVENIGGVRIYDNRTRDSGKIKW